MNDIKQWQNQNNSYLSNALQWLRLRLLRLADEKAPKAQSRKKKCGWFTCRDQSANVSSTHHTDDNEIVRLEEELATAEKSPHPPAAVILSERLGLSRFEQNLLLLCAAMELDPAMAELCCRCQNDAQRNYPTFALAFEVFDDPDWKALAATSPLRYWRLLDIHQPGSRCLTLSTLNLDERILNYLKGINYLDDRLSSYMAPPELNSTQAMELSASQQAIADLILHNLRNAAPNEPQTVQLLGTDSESKREIAKATAQALGLQLFPILAGSLPLASADMESLTRLWQRESYLMPFALYLDCADDHENHAAVATQSFAARLNGLVFVDTREIHAKLGSDTMAFDVAKPSTAEQQTAWQTLVSSLDKDDSGRLASQFNLNLPTIKRISQTVAVDEILGGSEQFRQLWQACLKSTRPRLDKLAHRIEPKASWNDLVLPDDIKGLLQQITEQVPNRHKVYDDWGFRQKMSRGLGISVLFAGASGTGKTMAAEVIASQLNLNLYRIDLSAVVSKYIGETEKNLRQVFDAAEDGGTLLFFDEADALFGKRSEVKESHDRFANTQIADLLQRMEAYNGLAILATNMKSALDSAFLRRLRFIVNFAFPGPSERKLIWQKAFTGDVFGPDTQFGNLDFNRLAQFNLTGGNIHSIALNAAFLAAQSGEYVGMRHVMQAVRTEFRKLEKPINEAEFRVLEVVKGGT
ncbi:ATP-binding protein [Methylomonas sp. MgM2]